MSGRRVDSKKLNFQHIYEQIGEHGKLISELANEYGMSEGAFKAKLKMGLAPNLYSSAIKADEFNRICRLKERRNKKVARHNPPIEKENVMVGTAKPATAEELKEKKKLIHVLRDFLKFIRDKIFEVIL